LGVGQARDLAEEFQLTAAVGGEEGFRLGKGDGFFGSLTKMVTDLLLRFGGGGGE